MTLETYELLNGAHTTREEGMCAMEFVAYLANEPHSDKPTCVSPLITSFIISCNDTWTTEKRQLLKPFLKRSIGTRDGKDIERAKIFAMYALTRISPWAIELIGLKDHADKMRAAKTLDEGIVAAKYAAKYAVKYVKYVKYVTDAEYAAKYAAESAKYAAKYSAEYAAKYAAESAKYAAESAKTKYAAESGGGYRAKIIQSCLDLLEEVISL